MTPGTLRSHLVFTQNNTKDLSLENLCGAPFVSRNVGGSLELP